MRLRQHVVTVCFVPLCTFSFTSRLLRVTDSKYRESLDRFENSKTLKLCLKNAFREFSSKILFRFSKNLTSSRNSQKMKIHILTSLNMQKIRENWQSSSVVFAFLIHLLRYLSLMVPIWFTSLTTDVCSAPRAVPPKRNEKVQLNIHRTRIRPNIWSSYEVRLDAVRYQESRQDF